VSVDRALLAPRAVFAATALAAAAADQAGKAWSADRFGTRPGDTLPIGPVRLELVHNTGAAFGLGAGRYRGCERRDRLGGVGHSDNSSRPRSTRRNCRGPAAEGSAGGDQPWRPAGLSADGRCHPGGSGPAKRDGAHLQRAASRAGAAHPSRRPGQAAAAQRHAPARCAVGRAAAGVRLPPGAGSARRSRSRPGDCGWAHAPGLPSRRRDGHARGSERGPEGRHDEPAHPRAAGLTLR
jgi:hypothetical protein